jgi:hypothetical protein
MVDQRAQIKSSLKRQREQFDESEHEREYVPLAARVKKWQDKTPERWKREPRPRSPPYQAALTHPAPFMFHTEQRVRRERAVPEPAHESQDSEPWSHTLTEPVSPHLRVDRRAHREHVMDMSELERPAFNLTRYVTVRHRACTRITDLMTAQGADRARVPGPADQSALLPARVDAHDTQAHRGPCAV